MTQICFIGAGNMASSIIGGLIANGTSANTITATARTPETLTTLAKTFRIHTEQDNTQAVQNADVIVLAVKPQGLKAVTLEIAPYINADTLVISVAAGITASAIESWLGGNAAVIRCMPNTPSLVQMGASGLFANSKVSSTQKAFAEQLLAATGVTVWLDDEKLMDAVTAVSGSGPAYFFMLMESMIAAGVKQGLSTEQATQLTLQTAAGAARLAQQSDVSVAELRRRVTSPGGTTEQAILSFEDAGLREIVDTAMVKCAQRSKTMASEFS